MGLQFMLSCGIGWSTKGGDGEAACAAHSSSQALEDGSSGDDDLNSVDSGEGETGADVNEALDFSKIDVEHLLDDRARDMMTGEL